MRYLFILFFNCAPLIAVAQLVSSVQAQQEGQDVVVSYTLETESLVEINLFVSTDQGRSWQGPLLHCTGDVGKNVSAGSGKRIRWAVLQERELVGDGIRFKVVAKAAVVKPWLNPDMNYGSVTDIDGNTYATIQIGRQVWMAENVRTTRYRNGDTIPNVKDGGAWGRLTTGAWAHYENDVQYENPYGKLYNWYAAADRRGICPKGWHVPTDAEWTTLTDQLGDEGVAGGKLKGKTLWRAPNTGATNGSGFSGLPGGSRNFFEGTFNALGFFGYWWSASESGAESAWYRNLGYNNAGVNRTNYRKRNGFCVRCVRD